MWPIKLCPDAGTVIIENHLCASFGYYHALSCKFAILLVKVNVPDVCNRPTVRRRQVAVEIQEFSGAYFGIGEKVKINANAAPIADHSVYGAVPGHG